MTGRKIRNRVFNEAEVKSYLKTHLKNWFYLDNSIRRCYVTRDWKSGLLVAGAVAHLAEVGWHHPELDVCYESVTVKFSTHNAGGITRKDFEMAEKVENLVTWSPSEDDTSSLEVNPNKLLV